MPKQTAGAPRGRRSGRTRARAAAGGRPPKATPEAGLAATEATPMGAATLTAGLDRYDQERASSLADEGGMAGAAVEAQPAPRPRPSIPAKLWVAAGLAGLAALYLRRSR